MQLIKPDTNIDFVGKRKLALIISAILILIGFASLIVKGGPEDGIDLPVERWCRFNFLKQPLLLR